MTIPRYHVVKCGSGSGGGVIGNEKVLSVDDNPLKIIINKDKTSNDFYNLILHLTVL